MDNYFKMQIPATSQNESFARNVIASFSLILSPTIEEINDIKTAVSEAVTNSVVHAYCNNTGIIDISSTIENNVLTVTITDYGKGIEDIAKAREPFYTTGENDERSGMGFTVMETFMDNVDVISQVGKGTTVILKKTFSNDRPRKDD